MYLSCDCTQTKRIQPAVRIASPGLGALGVSTTGVIRATLPAVSMIPVVGPAIAGIIGLVTSIFHIGPDPRNRPDTIAIETGLQAVNGLWYQISGEALDGITCQAPPGDMGKHHCSMLGSKYPNVPAGPGGNPAMDPLAVQQQIDQVFAQTKAALLKSSSAKNLWFTDQTRFDQRLQAMAAYRAQHGTGAAGTALAASGPVPGWLIPAAIGAAILLS
jgi:hypothetical protein